MSNVEAKRWIEAKRVPGGSSVAEVSAGAGGSSVATGSPSQRAFWKKAANGHKQTSLRASTACAQKCSSCARFGYLRAEEMQSEDESRNVVNNEHAKVLVFMYSDMYLFRYVCIQLGIYSDMSKSFSK
jgi:hypothetical protein